ncbi:hypothetical protein LTR86_006168 [Recurvomyces mirabilis]|nr:hypothetical protein LTR86_006168 [Recurvomyces mirabilis]
MATTTEVEQYELRQDLPATQLVHNNTPTNTESGTSITPETRPFESSLPPADTGHAAYTLLLAAFVFEALLWGFPLSFGVFQDYYSQLPQFQNSPYVSIIGTTASGISYLAAPITIPLIKRYSRWRRQMIWVGWPICLFSLVAGSFANTLPTLILTQGVMYGAGFIVFYYPILSFVNEFWITRRGLAYGLLCSASGVSGTVMPFLARWLLERYGYHTTLRVIAIGLFVLTAPLVPFLKGRLPVRAVSGELVKTDWSFLRLPLFWIYSASNIAMGFGFFFPSLYLPSYATANGLSSIQGALLLALMSISQVAGQSSYGYLSDGSVSLDVLAASAALVPGVAAFTAWGLSHTFAVLVVFAIIYGFFAAGYTALWGRMGMKISSDPSAAFAAFGLFNFQKGLGNVLAGPIGGALLSNVVEIGSYGANKYGRTVIFTGSCMLGSAMVIPLCYAARSLRLQRY